jgi:low affinity Fe/Cu permease
MDLMKEFIDDIPERQGWTTRQKLDELLRIDSKMYTNLGIDSTDEERAATKKISRYIYETVKKVDKDIGEELLRAIDS